MPTSPQLPPYAVRPVEFAFRAIAQRAARLSLGGEREVALAALTAARFARASVGEDRLPRPLREARAVASKVWFATLTLPAHARMAAQRVVEASASDDRQALVAGLEELIEVVTPVLDRAASAELRAVVRLVAARDDAVPNA